MCAISGAALAQAPAPAPVDPFIGKAALGYLATNGNTESTNANGSFEVTWDLDGPWKHDWNARAISARTNDVMTAESYSAAYKATRDFSATSYLFFSGDWRQDQFAGYDRQVSEAIGYGRRLLDTPRHMLALEGGGGAKQSDLIDGQKLDEAIIRGGLDYLFTHLRQLGVQSEAPARARRRQPLHGIDVGAEDAHRRQPRARVVVS